VVTNRREARRVKRFLMPTVLAHEVSAIGGKNNTVRPAVTACECPSGPLACRFRGPLNNALRIDQRRWIQAAVKNRKVAPGQPVGGINGENLFQIAPLFVGRVSNLAEVPPGLNAIFDGGSTCRSRSKKKRAS
jgi:hypothetical protein